MNVALNDLFAWAAQEPRANRVSVRIIAFYAGAHNLQTTRCLRGMLYYHSRHPSDDGSPALAPYFGTRKGSELKAFIMDYGAASLPIDPKYVFSVMIKKPALVTADYPMILDWLPSSTQDTCDLACNDHTGVSRGSSSLGFFATVTLSDKTSTP